MAEKSKEAWLDATLGPEREVKADSGPASAPGGTREAMSWIRALANDWEDTRSHAEPSK